MEVPRATKKVPGATEKVPRAIQRFLEPQRASGAPKMVLRERRFLKLHRRFPKKHLLQYNGGNITGNYKCVDDVPTTTEIRSLMENYSKVYHLWREIEP